MTYASSAPTRQPLPELPEHEILETPVGSEFELTLAAGLDVGGLLRLAEFVMGGESPATQQDQRSREQDPAAFHSSILQG